MTLDAASDERLKTCAGPLQAVVRVVAEEFPLRVLEGHRGQAAQDKAFAEGKSQKKWPDGNHNAMPSKAVDMMPLPIDWSDRERLSLFAGYVLATASALGVSMRWGGDWNRDWQLRDNRFDDLVHFEIVDP